nr:hypothetical protein [Mycobacterium tuberculosis]
MRVARVVSAESTLTDDELFELRARDVVGQLLGRAQLEEFIIGERRVNANR